MKVKINGQVYDVISYQSENLGTRANPEMYLKEVTADVNGVATTFSVDNNEIELGGVL
jgi:hypothetical protein